eukprot:10571536-Lingulodinium_polyedra.AAC.1
MVSLPQRRDRADRVRARTGNGDRALRGDGRHGRHAPRGRPHEHRRLIAGRLAVVRNGLARPDA